MGHRISPEAERDLDDLWLYVAKESGSIDIADGAIDTITSRFYLLATFPQMGRICKPDFGSPFRSFSVGEYVILYALDDSEDLLILRVVHGRRDFDSLFGI